MNVRRIAATLLAAATALVLAACQAGPAGSGGDPGQDNPYGLISPGQIRVASVGDLKPYTFTDENGEFTGFDVELFREVAHRIGVDDVVFTGQDFSAILPGVANGQFDVGVAAIGITPERSQSVAFSDGYLAGYLTILAPAGTTLAAGSDFAGIRLGVVQGTLQEAYAMRTFPQAELVRFPDNNAGVAALGTGSIDAHFLDYESAKLYIQQNGLVSVEDIPSFDAPAGFAVAKENTALVDALNGALQEVMADGTWKALHEKWFPGTPMPDEYLPAADRTGAPATSQAPATSAPATP